MLSHVLKDVTTCDKLNVAAIGNVVAQLHVHIVARRRDDAAWPRPVWGVAPAHPYEPAELDRFIARIRQEVAFG
jgi:diadenosine tetraphosphate (Ap4A) HIT family hydrolase